MRKLFIAVLLALLALAPGAQAQTNAPLFSSHETLPLTLTAPMRTLVNHRSRRPELEGMLSLNGSNGQPVALDLEVTTRGHSRLVVCDFPPLKLNFKKGELDGTVFAGQNKLKLVTRCQSPRQFEEYLELEYIAYRIYNEISDYSFRVRPVDMTYVDTDRGNRVHEAPAFFIEHIDGVAERKGMKTVDVLSVPVGDLIEPNATKFWLFQFLIGNTDISDRKKNENEDECCHNGAVLQSTTDASQIVVVPYDFDYAGLVDAEYAVPATSLHISSVRQRVYRGRCSSNPYLEDTIAIFNEARPRIERLFDTDKLSQHTREEALEYIDDAFAIFNDPVKLESTILMKCRGGQDPQ